MTNDSTENTTTDIIDRNRTVNLPASFPTEYKSEFFIFPFASPEKPIRDSPIK